MKVALITILDNTNFGTYLQALASGLVLKDLGCEVEVVNYVRPSMTQRGMSRAILEDRGFLRWLNRRRSIPASIELREKDVNFLRNYLKLTRRYGSFDDLLHNPPIADVYITGSDQVWNSYYNRGIDKAFFLEFAPKGKKRLAYAASIGMDKFPTDEVEEVYSYLMKYSAISVREIGAKTLLENLNINSTLVLDPTLLLDHKSWNNIANKYNTLISQEPYLLVYTVEKKRENKLIERYSKEIATRRKLKICQVSYGAKKNMLKMADLKYSYATPEIFLSLMLNASFVIVSSFHGTAFSVNFNKQFLTVSPENFNSRIDSLLGILGLQNRIICNESYNIDNLIDIDYNDVNSKLRNERKTSIEFLKQVLHKDC